MANAEARTKEEGRREEEEGTDTPTRGGGMERKPGGAGQWMDSGWTVGMGSFRTVDGRGRARMGEDRLVQGWRLQVVNSARPGLIWGNGTPRRRLAQVVSVVTL